MKSGSTLVLSEDEKASNEMARELFSSIAKVIS